MCLHRLLIVALLTLCACDDESGAEGAVDLPRAAKEVPAAEAPAQWARTGKETMPLDNIVAQLEPHWRETASCEQVGYVDKFGGDTPYEIQLLHVYSRSAGKVFNLACEIEQHGHYVSHVAEIQKEIWSDYDKAWVMRNYTFFRIRSADGEADFATYLVSEVRPTGGVRLGGCDHDTKVCYRLYRPGYVINMQSGLYTHFKMVRRDRNEFHEETGPIGMLLGMDQPDVLAFVSGDTDGIPRSLALRALVREVQRQYPEGTRQALDLVGVVRPMRNGIVIEDVGANFGLTGTDASYLVKLLGTPECAETENAQVRQCTLKVETSVFAYNRATGSRQTKLAQIANVAAGGNQTGEIEALFIQDEAGWRMVVTEEIARFLSGVDRKNNWVVRTGDGRTLSGAAAVSCIANPRTC